MPEAIRVGVYDNNLRVGGVVFHSLAVFSAKDYTCSLVGVLTHDEVKEVAKELRRIPLVNSGTVRPYVWRVER